MASCLRRNKFLASTAVRDLYNRAISQRESKSARCVVRTKCRNAFNQATKRHMKDVLQLPGVAGLVA